MIPIGWRLRSAPLAAAGVLGVGPVAVALLRRAVRRPDDALAHLEGVYNRDLVVVVGPTDHLPWADGATWLGRDPQVSELWLPTLVEPDVPLDLLARAVVPRAALPVVVVPGRVVSLASARPLDREIVAALLSKEAK